MGRQEQRTVTLSGPTLKQLEAKYELEKKKNPRLAFAAFIADNALMELERRDMMREKTGYISKAGFEEDRLFLNDAKKPGTIFEVQIKSKKLKCLTDNDFECIHVGFGLALPEVRRALLLD